MITTLRLVVIWRPGVLSRCRLGSSWVGECGVAVVVDGMAWIHIDLRVAFVRKLEHRCVARMLEAGPNLIIHHFKKSFFTYSQLVT